MNFLFVWLISLGVFYSFEFHQPAALSDLVQWLSPTTHDFGDIPQGETVSYSFEFKNISDQAIVIDAVRPNCGCTTPDWPVEPTQVAGTNKIKVEFDAKHPGYFRKKVRVFFNGQRKSEILYLEGYVE